jgi:uncharacterized protein
MTLNHFQDLVEIQGLDNKILVHQQLISEQRQRLLLLQNQIREKQELLSVHTREQIQKKLDLEINEQLLEQLNQKIARIKENLKSVTTEKQMLALESELSLLETQRLALEDKVFALLDNVETIEKTIPDLEQFLKGSQQSQTQIEQEASAIVREEEEKIKDLQLRIDHLLEQIPQEMRNVFLPVYQKFRFKNPLCFVENEHCNQCFFLINMNLNMMLEKGTSLELCPSCQRLLTPHSVMPS